MAEEIRLSVKETNKLRARLGLPLLPTGPPEKPITDAEAAKNARTPKNGVSLSVQETNRLRRSLGLRPAVPDGPDATATTDTEIDSSLANYAGHSAGEDLGVRVGHSAKELSSLRDGEVFTLEDRGILDEDDDCLVNEGLERHSKQQKPDRERKKLGRSVGAGLGVFYDDESEPEVEIQPVLIVGTTITPSRVALQDPQPPSGNVVKIAGLFDDLDEKQPAKHDRPIKFKKSKMKSGSKRQIAEQPLVVATSEMVTLTLAIDDDVDDDIEDFLARSRREKVIARAQMSVEELSAEARTNARMSMVADLKDGLVFDPTRDFLDTLGDDPLRDGDEIAAKSDSSAGIVTDSAVPTGGSVANADETDIKDVLNVAQLTATNGGQEIKQIERMEAVAIEKPASNDLKTPYKQSEEPEPSSPTIEAPRLGGILSTLKYLRQHSKVPSESAKKAFRMKRDKEKKHGLVRIKISIQERLAREELKKDPAYDRATPEQKEKIFDRVLSERLVSEGIVSDSQVSGRYQRHAGTSDDLANYNPQVQVLNKDETGKVLSQKEAWKALSHRYHGLAPKNAKRAKVKRTE